MSIPFTAKILIVSSALIMSSACATVTRGSSDVFVVETTPSGAQVKTSNQFACDATPCSFKMSRKSEFDVTVSKEGYKTTTHFITNKMSGAGGAGMAGNVLVGGIIGAGVDVYTGASKDLTPNPLVIVMEPEGGIAATEAITQGDDNS